MTHSMEYYTEFKINNFIAKSTFQNFIKDYSELLEKEGLIKIIYNKQRNRYFIMKEGEFKSLLEKYFVKNLITVNSETGF